MVDDQVLRSWGRFDQELRDDPYPLYARLRAAAPAHRVTMPDGRAVWLVTRYDDARSALADPRLAKDPRRFRQLWPRAAQQNTDGAVENPDRRNFVDSPFAYHMLNADPPDHTRLRRLVSTAFTARRVESLRPRVHEITDTLIDGMSARDTVDLIESFAFPLPITVICELLGVPLSDQSDIRRLFTTMLSSGPTPEERARSLQAGREIAAYITALIAAKRAAPADDMLSALIAARDGTHTLTEQELTSMAFLLIIAGHETTVNLIGNGMAALLTHPDQLAALRADPSVVSSAVEEFLRYDGPVEHATFRFSTEPMELGGVTIPAGQRVLILLASADRDPDRFDRADDLDVRRGDPGHLAFGHGIHFCLGAPLARMEGQIAFTALLGRLPDMRLAVPADQLHYRPGMFLRGLRELPVAPAGRHATRGMVDADDRQGGWRETTDGGDRGHRGRGAGVPGGCGR